MKSSESPFAIDTLDLSKNYLLLSGQAVVKLLTRPSNDRVLLLFFSVTLFTCLVENKQIIFKEIFRKILTSLTRSFIGSNFGEISMKSDVVWDFTVKRVQGRIRLSDSSSSFGVAIVLREGKGW